MIDEPRGNGSRTRPRSWPGQEYLGINEIAFLRAREESLLGLLNDSGAKKDGGRNWGDVFERVGLMGWENR